MNCINLMNEGNYKIEQARKILIRQALDDICDVPGFSNFYLHAHYVIAKLGLLLKAREECLFIPEEWSNSECKDDLIKKIEEFLIKNVR